MTIKLLSEKCKGILYRNIWIYYTAFFLSINIFSQMCIDTWFIVAKEYP